MVLSLIFFATESLHFLRVKATPRRSSILGAGKEAESRVIAKAAERGAGRLKVADKRASLGVVFVN